VENPYSDNQSMPRWARGYASSIQRGLPSDAESKGENFRTHNRGPRPAHDLICSQGIDTYVCGCSSRVRWTRVPDCSACLEAQQAPLPQTKCHPRLFPMLIPRMCDKCLSYIEAHASEHPPSLELRTLEVHSIPPESPEPEPISSTGRKEVNLEMQGSSLHTRRRAKKAA
jgi:hypothetical protein